LEKNNSPHLLYPKTKKERFAPLFLSDIESLLEFVTLLEFLDSAGRIDNTLFAGEEGVTFTA
jgi:hypothetical protein